MTKFQYLLIFFLIINVQKAVCSDQILPLIQSKIPSKILAVIERGEVVTDSSVKTKQKTQELNLWAAGLHKNTCPIALRKIALYESYKDFIDFIKRSDYSEKTQLLRFDVQHSLLPSSFYLLFQMPRMKQEGIYPFVFKEGIFPELRGNVYISTYKERCLFFLDAHWDGKSTRYPDSIVELFTRTLSRIGMERVFRFSTF